MIPTLPFTLIFVVSSTSPSPLLPSHKIFLHIPTRPSPSLYLYSHFSSPTPTTPAPTTPTPPTPPIPPRSTNSTRSRASIWTCGRTRTTVLATRIAVGAGTALRIAKSYTKRFWEGRGRIWNWGSGRVGWWYDDIKGFSQSISLPSLSNPLYPTQPPHSIFNSTNPRRYPSLPLNHLALEGEGGRKVAEWTWRWDEDWPSIR